MGTLLQTAHVEVVAARIEVVVGADADAPSLADRRRDVGIHHVAAIVVESVIQLPLEGVACQLRSAVDAIGNDAILQGHVLWSHRLHRLVTHTVMPGLVGVDLIVIIGYWQAVLIDIGIAGDGETQGNLSWL